MDRSSPLILHVFLFGGGNFCVDGLVYLIRVDDGANAEQCEALDVFLGGACEKSGGTNPTTTVTATDDGRRTTTDDGRRTTDGDGRRTTDDDGDGRRRTFNRIPFNLIDFRQILFHFTEFRLIEFCLI